MARQQTPLASRRCAIEPSVCDAIDFRLTFEGSSSSQSSSYWFAGDLYAEHTFLDCRRRSP